MHLLISAKLQRLATDTIRPNFIQPQNHPRRSPGKAVKIRTGYAKDSSLATWLGCELLFGEFVVISRIFSDAL